MLQLHRLNYRTSLDAAVLLLRGTAS